MKRIGILISGRGSNMLSLLDAMESGFVPGKCVLVASNVADAPGLTSASARNVPTAVIDHRASSSREEHDARMLAGLREAGAEIICLAGYMRLLSPMFVRAFPHRILNIHPALLPSFPGLHVQRKALEHGVRFSGCTVHLVDEEVDHGPIVLQAVVPILPNDDEDSLSARILAFEHIVYPRALKLLCEEKIEVRNGRVELLIPLREYTELLNDLVYRVEE